MAKLSFKINKNDLVALQKEINQAVDNASEGTFKFFKKVTPIKSGNARRNTRYKERRNSNTILGDYDYSGVLDAGRSKQAPKGMTKPSLKELERLLKKELRKI